MTPDLYVIVTTNVYEYAAQIPLLKCGLFYIPYNISYIMIY